jgi:SecD/SecF fusion protein
MNYPEIQVTLTDEGAKRFAMVTRQNVGERLAIVIEGKVYFAPRVLGEIPGGRLNISGSFTMEQAVQLAAKINDAATNTR